MNSNTEKIKIRSICSSGGMLAPMAVCGDVSVYSDDKGHRCCAHGNFKCKYKKENSKINVD